jgi:hypothetical protein
MYLLFEGKVPIGWHFLTAAVKCAQKGRCGVAMQGLQLSCSAMGGVMAWFS